MSTSNLLQATDYLLSNGSSGAGGGSVTAARRGTGPTHRYVTLGGGVRVGVPVNPPVVIKNWPITCLWNNE
jgi:hypothetical protein